MKKRAYCRRWCSRNRAGPQTDGVLPDTEWHGVLLCSSFADAMEVIPSTLAENAGLNPISTVTELRNRHAQGEKLQALMSEGWDLQHSGGNGCPASVGVSQCVDPSN